MSTTKSKTLAITAVASLSLFLGACGSDDEPAPADETSEAPADDTADPAANLVGPGCEDYASQVPDGAGSVEGMAQDPVATAASNNPLLKTLTAAVSGKLNKDVNLVDTLNGGEFTVFAPVDDAFAKLPEETVKTLGTPEGAEALTSVLTYHVVAGQLGPDEVAGTHETVNGADVTVEGEGDAITVGESKAKVICGGVTTANATVYLIDSVLMPPS
jgi:uncharacterized surface protein with fasciclin (FAS1) repeats